MELNRITEEPSFYRHIEQMPTEAILYAINQEDHRVPVAVNKVVPAIGKLVEAIVGKMKDGGRLFYIGAGTSGRLGVLDASECPPTYGVPPTWVVGVMAGGDAALRFGIEDAEDKEWQGWADLQAYAISDKDVVVGIAASGTTPYVVGALKQAQHNQITTGCIVCNTGSPVASYADYPVEVVVGPEFVTGSTRMKSGTAQKLVLNMISTSVMIRLGRILDNRMVHMEISNEKLIDRAVRMLMERKGLTDYEEAKDLLMRSGSLEAALGLSS